MIRLAWFLMCVAEAASFMALALCLNAAMYADAMRPHYAAFCAVFVLLGATASWAKDRLDPR